MSSRRAASDTIAQGACDSATIRSLIRCCSDAMYCPAWISARPRGPEDSTLWWTNMPPRHPRPHRAGQAARPRLRKTARDHADSATPKSDVSRDRRNWSHRAECNGTDLEWSWCYPRAVSAGANSRPSQLCRRSLEFLAVEPFERVDLVRQDVKLPRSGLAIREKPFTQFLIQQGAGE
ncbi:MAG: hypothetical protein QOI05_2211 [Bradyrhizobium sp.]|nr:hypothetical protein [Bradyrhizobium sp.]